MTKSYRDFASISDQTSVHYLANVLCRKPTPSLMAATSSHLRNFAVAEVIGLIGTLDSHPTLKKHPVFSRGKAAFQQGQGTTENHFSHVAPSNLLLNGKPLTTFFGTARAESMVRRVLGMGVMAPDDWAELKAYELEPRQQNITDNIAERFAHNDGLVGAFESTAQAAADSGRWDCSGTPIHNSSSLVDFVVTHYQKTWVPHARAAYEFTLTRLGAQFTEARKAGHDERVAKYQVRIGLVESQLAVLTTETLNAAGAVRNVLAATVAETWK
ncbi:MAG: hypothetical protein ABIO06_00050 [Pseudolysinimonas sp.]